MKVHISKEINVVEEGAFKQFKDKVSEELFDKVSRDEFKRYQVGVSGIVGNLGKEIAEALNKAQEARDDFDFLREERKRVEKSDCEWLGRWVKRYIDLEDRVIALEKKLAEMEGRK